MAQSPAPSAKPGRPARANRLEPVRLAAAALLGGLAVLFAVLNLDEVAVNWIFFEGRTPLIVVIVLSVLVGAILGAVLVGLVLRSRYKR